MAQYAAIAGIVVALLGSLTLAWLRVGSAAVKCGVCGHKQRLLSSRKKTFSCRRCKKTLPRRLALSTDG